MNYYHNEYDIQESDTDSNSNYDSSDNESILETESESDSESEYYSESESEFALESRNSKFKLGIVELYNKRLHGFTRDSYSKINGNYLILESFDYRTISRTRTINYYFKKVLMASRHYTFNSCYNRDINIDHNIIRNYKNIVNKQTYYHPQIIEPIYLPSGEHICIIKTFWLKLIQRKWKKIFQEKKALWRRRASPSALFYKMIHGRWPDNCNHMPSIYGMLSDL
jgi:hypothetical protein